MAFDYLHSASLVPWRQYRSWHRVGDNDSLPRGVFGKKLRDKENIKLVSAPDLAYITPATSNSPPKATLLKNGELVEVDLTFEAMTKMLEQLAIEIRNAKKPHFNFVGKQPPLRHDD